MRGAAPGRAEDAGADTAMSIVAEITYSESGRPESGRSVVLPPLVLIHGSGGGRLDWPRSLRELPGVHVVALDLPGHGSSPPPGRDRVADYAAAVAGLLDSLAIDSAVLAGHSLGGAIALHMALSYPERVQGLVLVGAGARLRVHPDILDRILVDPAGTARLITSWAYASAAPQALTEASLDRLLGVDPRVIWGDYSACHHFDIMGDLGSVGAPSLVIVGKEDRMTPVKFSEYLVRNLPDAELVVVEDAGHMVALERPGLVTRAIARRIKSL